jgi:3-deoxy-manno-octulosonate cytidylyltransferase (CMP-KDO synthetase)
MSFKVVIPARYQSTRLPGKPLVDIAGRPLIQHVFERAVQSHAGEVIIATDDEQIFAAAETFGACVVMTSATHQSGTDRITEVADRLGWPDKQIVVNVQGDEPLIPSQLINLVANNLATDSQASVATLCEAISNKTEINNPNCVKVVFDQQQHALYFSRAAIPYIRESSGSARYFRHIGLYAYRAGFLRAFSAAAPAMLEEAEKLEQLRALAMGRRIHVAVTTESPGAGIDTPEDLERVRKLLS